MVFLCHMPALWGKTEPIYRAMLESTDFEPVVIAVPQGAEADDAIVKWLADRGIDARQGRCGTSWLNLKELEPDYVFHGVPYSLYYPPGYTPGEVARFARLCYVPYVGQLIYAGGVADTTHDPSYFKHDLLAFLSDEDERLHLSGRMGAACPSGLNVVGSPQLEQIVRRNAPR